MPKRRFTFTNIRKSFHHYTSPTYRHTVYLNFCIHQHISPTSLQPNSHFDFSVEEMLEAAEMAEQAEQQGGDVSNEVIV